MANKWLVVSVIGLFFFVLMLNGCEDAPPEPKQVEAVKSEPSEEQKAKEAAKKQKAERKKDLPKLNEIVEASKAIGFIYKIDETLHIAYVDSSYWEPLKVDEKENITTTLARWCEFNCYGDLIKIVIKDSSTDKELAYYDPNWGYGLKQ